MIQNRTGYPGPIFFCVLSFLRLRPHLKHALSSLQQLRSRERESVKSFAVENGALDVDVLPGCIAGLDHELVTAAVFFAYCPQGGYILYKGT